MPVRAGALRARDMPRRPYTLFFARLWYVVISFLEYSALPALLHCALHIEQYLAGFSLALLP